MDDANSLKSENVVLGDKNYGSFTLKKIVDFYIKSAIDVMGSNGNSPTFAKYSQDLQTRLSEKFGLERHRLGYLLTPLIGYGNMDKNGTTQNSPVIFKGVAGGHLRVYLSKNLDECSVDNLVDKIIDEIGPVLDKRFTEFFLIQRPAPVQHPRIDSFEEWAARVMNKIC